MNYFFTLYTCVHNLALPKRYTYSYYCYRRSLPIIHSILLSERIHCSLTLNNAAPPSDCGELAEEVASAEAHLTQGVDGQANGANILCKRDQHNVNNHKRLFHTLSGCMGKAASHAAIAGSSPAEVALIYTMHVALRGYCP